jgi:hypothetical protein
MSPLSGFTNILNIKLLFKLEKGIIHVYINATIARSTRNLSKLLNNDGWGEKSRE